jgi:hypothetical protein
MWVRFAVNKSNYQGRAGEVPLDLHTLVGLSSRYRYNPSQVPGVPARGAEGEGLVAKSPGGRRD